MKELSTYHDEIVEAAKQAFEHIYFPGNVMPSDGDLFDRSIEDESGLVCEIQGFVQVTADLVPLPGDDECIFQDVNVKVRAVGGSFHVDGSECSTYTQYYGVDEIERLERLIKDSIMDEMKSCRPCCHE